MILKTLLLLSILNKAYVCADWSENSNVSNLLKLINEEERDILVVYSSPKASNVFKILEPVVIVDIKGDLGVVRNLWKFNFYLIMPDGMDDFKKFLHAFHRTPAWNPRAKFLVICSTQFSGEYFELAWKYLLIKFAVITSTFDAFTYNPFANSSCGDCTAIQNLQIWKPEAIFPARRLASYHGCPVNVLPLTVPPYVINTSAEKNPGFDVVLLREMSSQLNFTIVYVKNPFNHWGYKLPNGTFTLMYSAVCSGDADLMIGMPILNGSLFNDFDFSDGYISEHVVFYVPAALPVEAWKNFGLVFSSLTWILIAASIILASFVFWLGGKISGGQSENKSAFNWLLTSLCILLAAFNSQPKSWFLSTIFLCWSIYCLLINSTYQGSLISFLTKPAYEHQIATLQELAASELAYGGYPTLRATIHDPESPLFIKFYNNWQNCPLTEECINRTAFQRDFGVLKNTRQIFFLTKKYYTSSSGRSMLYGLDPPANRFLTSLTFTKGFPLFESVQDLLLGLQENGLIDKWDRDVKSRVEGGADDSVKVLTMEHLKVAFIVLICGNVAAFLVFLIELLVGHSRRPIVVA